MAGAAAKKNAKFAKDRSFIYSTISVIFSLLNIVVRIGLFREGTSLGSLGQGIFLALVSFFALGMIQSSLSLGLGYSLWQDLFVINTAVQVLSLFSNWFWLIYLAVPGYGLFFFGNKIRDFVFSRHSESEKPRQSGSSKNKKRI